MEMIVTAINDNGQRKVKIKAIRITHNPDHQINASKLYMPSESAKEVFPWVVQFEIEGEIYNASEAHHDLQQEDGSGIRTVRLSKCQGRTKA
ncbi:hypothetical protein [Chromobacterium sinusclupearum]|uniref:hypothetical protein n=1 Tax=Chromobacterium sinusclupearum TaxID=2077146 RepID=UPI0011AF6107|nr:hypothetical protein [Chromobacterium sinusclupearum]